MIFDIKDFYPSIMENLLKKTTDFADGISNIDMGDKKIIFHARKLLLFNNNDCLQKKVDIRDRKKIFLPADVIFKRLFLPAAISASAYLSP